MFFKIKKSYTFIEVILVIIVIAIVGSVSVFNAKKDHLFVAIDQIILHLNYTKLLALRDNKYNNKKDGNSTKYWFKSWWQIKFTNSGNTLFYQIFSDQSSSSKSPNFNKKVTHAQWEELAYFPQSEQYMLGNYQEIGATQFPFKKNVLEKMNLTLAYGIIRLDVKPRKYSKSSMRNGLGDRVSILFDNMGQVFLYEGYSGDKGDIYPYDKKRRNPLKEKLELKFSSLKDEACICIYPVTGYIENCQCE